MSEGFLSRWSRRKTQVRETVKSPLIEQPLPEKGEGEDLPSPVALVPTPSEQEEQERLVAELPDLESLTEESDFSAFMQNGVPEDLQKLALRKLWRSNPVFANLDGLNDYDEDFSIIRPLAAGVADELLKLMKENARPKDDKERKTEEQDVSEEDGLSEVAEPMGEEEPEVPQAMES